MTARTQTISPTAPAVPRIRARRLMVDTTPVVVQPVATPVVAIDREVLAELEVLAGQQFVANKAKNKYNREADALEKVLYKKMLTAGIRDFITSVAVDGGVARIEAKISAPEGETISVEKLRTLVDDETFMKIVSATKKAVTDEAGTNVTVACTVPVPGKEGLRVKEVAL